MSSMFALACARSREGGNNKVLRFQEVKNCPLYTSRLDASFSAVVYKYQRLPKKIVETDPVMPGEAVFERRVVLEAV